MPRILMIDDDRSLLKMTRDFLESQGWTFQGAETSVEGLAMAARERPDLILLDVNLPDLDGFAVCRKVKADPVLGRVPIVLISGDRRKAEDILKGLEAQGADGYVLKPFPVTVLKAKLEAVLRAYQP
ncbi:MAG: response regulator transcription factor [Elusimicrobia bacterium]|nr:response regulator transcription factor [Elusimicrobiota bacterium]